MSAWVVALSLAAAAAFGWSTAAMHRDASATPPEVAGTARLLAHLLRQWRWLTGLAASLLGLGLHAAALSRGALTVVQPLIVTGLVFSLLFRSLLAGRRPGRSLIGWACVTAAGLALLLSAASAVPDSGPPASTAAGTVIGLGVLVSVGCWLAAARTGDAAAGVLLGAGTGVNFGLTAGTLKATTAADSLSQLLSSWPLYVLAVLGVSGFIANQVMYRRAALSASLPMLNLVNPVVALMFGVIVFGERPATTVGALARECAGLGAVLIGVVVLARQAADDSAPADPAEDAFLLG